MNPYFLKTLLIAVAFALTTNIVKGQRITVTYAGTGNAMFNGDGRPGNNTNISFPFDVCTDAANNVYFSDTTNRLRKISAETGIVTTIAGGGSSTADNIPATDALIPRLGYLCIDNSNNIYAVSGNRIRKINATTGLITTVAGSIAAGYSGDGGPASAALMNNIIGICVDATGNIFAVDNGNSRIRKISSATGMISTVVGTGIDSYSGDGGLATVAEISNPAVITASAGGDIYFSDQTASRIRKIAAATGVISLFAGNGSYTASGDGLAATTVGIGKIWGITTDPYGNVYIDDLSCACRKIDVTTGIINTFAGFLSAEGYDGDGGNSLEKALNYPYGLCFDQAGSMYIADHVNKRIRKVIPLSHTPEFAYGKGQSIARCPGYPIPVKELIAVVDIDSAQLETWSVALVPVHGVLSGFPHTVLSKGKSSYVMPEGMSYTATGSGTGSDSFKIKVSDGTLSDTITIYVNSSVPIVDSILGSPRVCLGATTNLSSVISGGTWSSSNSNATISATGLLAGVSLGDDTVFYTLSGACANTATLVVTIDQLPGVGAISGASIVYVGGSISLTDIDPGGRWHTDDSAIATVSEMGGIVTGLVTGICRITYTRTSFAGCTSDAYFTVTVADVHPAGISDAISNKGNITIAPNPAKDNFSIKMSSPYSEPVSIVVTDLMGKQLTLLTGTTNTTITATLPGLAAGMYLLNIRTEHEQMTRKVVLGQ